ncbi:hypothetical protein F4782DRAFT_536927 [Xylaria castorea]|nr:hypothetical protein F4782DRAFT_536927 [Xylaria castorea]
MEVISQRLGQNEVLAKVGRRVWRLFEIGEHFGFTIFGAPPVHFKIFHDKYVRKLGWIDENIVKRFSLSQALSVPASTKILYCINLIAEEFLPAMLEFLLWNLPGAFGMLGLSVGISNIRETLPRAVYTLFSGLNASVVGIIALAALQLSQKAITDKLTRILVFLWASVIRESASRNSNEAEREEARVVIADRQLKISWKVGLLVISLFVVTLIAIIMLRATVGPRDFLIGLVIIQTFPRPNFNFAYLGALMAANAGLNVGAGAVISFIGIFAPGMILCHDVMGIWDNDLRSVWIIKSALPGFNAAAQIGYIDEGSTHGTSLANGPWWVAVTAISYVGVLGLT